MPKFKKFTDFLLLGVCVFCYIYLGNFLNRENFVGLILLIAILFGIYLYLQKKEVNIAWAFLLRAVLIFAIPTLSDDFWRFIWDGTLLVQGNNPYEYIPSAFTSLNPFQSEIYANLNSKDYYSVYTPLNQLVFYYSSFLANESVRWNVVLLRLIIISAEYFSIHLLGKHFGKKAAYLYAFNPLIIIELTGNLHFEALVISFLLGAWHYWKENKVYLAGLLFGLAVGIKITPIIAIILIFSRLSKANSLKFLTGLSIGLFLCFFPLFFGTNFQHFFESFRLYFQSFEFNASIYFIARQIGYWLFGFNIIQVLGIALGLISFSSILFLSRSKLNFGLSLLLINFSYLIFSTTVHPWYLTSLILITILKDKYFGILWSFSVFFSYYFYSNYNLNILNALLIAEYAIVFHFFYFEMRKDLKINRQGLF